MVDNYFRVQLGGPIGSQERWSINPCYDPAGESVFGWNQQYGQQIADKIAALAIPASMNNALSNVAPLRTVRLELRNGQHALLGAATAQFSASGGSSETAKHPSTVAVVCSLRTDRVGASGRGRLYWPAIGQAIDTSSLRISAANRTALATDFTSFLKSIGTSILSTGAWEPWTAMPLSVISKTRGISTPVNRIMVGDVMDTQRRRRDTLVETYSTVAY